MPEIVRNTLTIAKREFKAYFSTPLAAVFLTIFVALTGAFAFHMGNFFERGQADLNPFFQYHPCSTCCSYPLSPCGCGRKSARRDHRTPDDAAISPWEAILGKFFAAGGPSSASRWCSPSRCGSRSNVLGNPDNGVIFASYIGSFLMAGAFLAIGSAVSAVTRNQVIAFIVAATICFLLVMSGLELVLNAVRLWMPGFVVGAISSLSFLTHFDRITKGVLELSSIVFYASLIIFALFANASWSS